MLTIWVARTLFTNGRTFLVDIFHGNEALADSVNKLLLMGFYLINIGYAMLTLRSAGPITGYQQSVEMLSVKVGTIILILGGMHFFNLYVFYKLRNRAPGICQGLPLVAGPWAGTDACPDLYARPQRTTTGSRARLSGETATLAEVNFPACSLLEPNLLPCGPVARTTAQHLSNQT